MEAELFWKIMSEMARKIIPACASKLNVKQVMSDKAWEVLSCEKSISFLNLRTFGNRPDMTLF